MKNLLRILMILSLILSTSAMFPGAAFASPSADGVTPTVPEEGLANKVYLPTIFGAVLYNVSGQVTGPENLPLAGVTVTDGSGITAITDQNGVYAMSLRSGTTALAAAKDGYLFSPTMVEVNVNSNLSGQDFSALTACTEGISNNSFEADAYWIRSGGAAYSSTVHHVGSWSMLTGILDPLSNAYNYSSVSTPLISIPLAATTVTLRAWLYTTSTEVATQVSEAPVTGLFGDATTAYDAQYVLILDGSNNLLETLVWTRSDNDMWTYHEFNLSKWAGSSVKIQIGSYNDGEDGVTAMYVDDVSLEMCDAVLPPLPLPAACSSLLLNNGFEYSANWGIPITAYTAGYSADYAYAGWQSMRTGIPLYKLANVYSYSDAWQTVTIPADATSAKLNIKLLPQSEEPELTAGTTANEPEVAEGMPAPGTNWADAVLYADTAYVVVLNPYTGVIIDWIWSKTNRDSSYWLDKSFDLMAFAGKTVRIQFGVFNDGYGGQSVMYADEAYVDVCTGALPPPPPPPPPPVCTERVDNNSFEASTDWYIPPTSFSAGYSTYVANSGIRSMRTGIKYLAFNTYSYSDFGQIVNIPSWANSATLSMYLYNLSSEPTTTLLAERPTAAEFGEAAMAGDVQYLLVLDLYGNWIDTLVWQRLNEGYWKYVAVDLTKYAGSTIKLQWGTYNDGWGGVTSMFVDDVSLVACP